MIDLFRHLNASEEKEFRQWAKDNYKPLDPIKGVWHPIVQDECKLMNEQHYERKTNNG
tara:strand:+ start:1781 stop:1954 length:174 start_codon:yes stop_codon:yes gene_type:complete